MPSPTQKVVNNSLIFILLAVITVIGVIKLSSGDSHGACDPGLYLMNCYQLDHDVCHKQWESTKEICQKQIEALHLAPGRLTSPIMDHCQKAKFDRVFRYVRKRSNECDQEIQEIETWQKSNPGF